MDDIAALKTRVGILKRELKQYESEFKAQHGRNAEREEIRKDASIWAKYGEYKALQKTLANQKQQPIPKPNPQVAQDQSIPLKTRPVNVVATTPRKHEKTWNKLDAKEVPPADMEETPACIRMALGPTPQRDGEVLGIFDMLPAGTPSRGDSTMNTNAISIIGATPSKPMASAASNHILSRTPQSSGKRFFLDAFAGTPLKRKCDEEMYTPNNTKRQYTTPSFLRRIGPSANQEEEYSMISAPPFKKRPLVRSLSTIIQGLKKQEEQRMDDDWDIMNELEAEERGKSAPPAVPTLLVEDSQAPEMPLGPDQGEESSEDEEAGPGALDANGNPRKVWKKKGLKRQTRRVIMRPVLHKPRKEADEEASDYDESSADAVAETQADGERNHDAQDDAADSEEKHDSQQSEHQSKRSKTKATKKGKEKGKEKDSAGKKTAPTALAHTNFRRLNIKNKNSKANGRGRKFGRR